ncbi:MAG: hypothetical protein KDA78_18265, partial [Planctomycetaceae bacterium]|nr:hypothetical protein [Planctomycetaceae bacterium]
MMGKQTIFRFDWRILMALAVILQPALSRGAEGDAPQPELTPRNTVIERTGNWLKASQPQQVEPWLDSVSRNSLLSFEQIIVSAVAMSDKTLAEQVDRVRKSSASDLTLLAAEINWSIEDPWIAQNTQLWWASELLQRQLYDEAWQVLSQIDAENIANPATLYYQRAVCAHQLLLPEDTKSSLDSLLALHEIPVRYRALGELMKQ